MNILHYLEASLDPTQPQIFIPLAGSPTVIQNGNSAFVEESDKHAIASLWLKQYKVDQNEKLAISYILNPTNELQPEIPALSEKVVSVPQETTNQKNEILVTSRL